MKKVLFLSLAALGFAVSNNAFAQKESDLEIIIESPTANQAIDYNASFDFSYRIVNHGDSAIEVFDTIIVQYTAMGVTLPDTFAGFSIAVGDTSDVKVAINLTHIFNLTADSTIEACAYIDATINTTANVVIDTIQDNDTACVTFTLKEEPNSIYSYSNFSEQFSIYPNPAQGNVNIAVTGWNSESALTVSVMDITGRVIATTKENINTANKVIELNTQNLSNGIYMIELRSGNEKAVAKFSKN